MKQLLILSLALCLVVAGADFLRPNENGELSLKVLLDDDFRKPSDQWGQIKKFEPFSEITYTDDRGIVLTRNPNQQPIPGKLFDTAFDFRSHHLPLSKGAEMFDLVVAATSNRPGVFLMGFEDSYWCRIVWYDQNDKRLQGEECYFSPRFRKDVPFVIQERGTIPRKAVFAAVEIGMDTPDLRDDQFFAFRRIRLTTGRREEILTLPLESTVPHAPVLLTPSPVKAPDAPVVFTIDDAPNAKLDTAKFFFDDQVITPSVSKNGERFTWKPAAPMSIGIHFLSAQVEDRRDGYSETLDAVLYHGDQNAQSKLTVRDDGMPMLNGKPFFALGIAALVRQGRNQNSYDLAFKEAAEAGLNLVRHWSTFNALSKDGQEYIAAAKKHNIYVSFSPTLTKDDMDVRRIAKGVANQLAYDRIISWECGDDTANSISPFELERKSRVIKAIDPYRLVTQADSVVWSRTVRSRYTNYVNATDNFQPEVYPIGCNNGKPETKEMTAQQVPVVIRDIKWVVEDQKRLAKSPKSIWPLIQYFHYKKGHPRYERMPTRDELRAMSYLAVIHGAHGLFWYRYASYPGTEEAGHGYTDQQWRDFCSVSLEFRSIIDILGERTGSQTQQVRHLSGPQKDGLGFESLNTLLKEHDGMRYLLVCNSAYDSVSGQFTIPDARQVIDLFSKKEFLLKNGAFTAEFSPYGATVFEIR